jgi:hypothetical protein
MKQCTSGLTVHRIRVQRIIFNGWCIEFISFTEYSSYRVFRNGETQLA